MCLNSYLIAGLQRLSLEESLKDSGLEDLDDLELSSTLDLETLQLSQGFFPILILNLNI